MSTPSSPSPMTPRPMQIQLEQASARSPPMLSSSRSPAPVGSSSWAKSPTSAGGRSWQGGSSVGRRAGGGRVASGRQFGSSAISNLPHELLLHIFALLPPYALVASQLVCQSWNSIIQDESAWRNAFERYYQITNSHNNNAVTLGRRLEPTSWKLEYVTRVRLLHRWHKSRTPTVVHNPNLGPLASIHFTFPQTIQTLSSTTSANSPTAPSVRGQPAQPTMLSVSLTASTALKSIPFTGKLSPKLLTATPMDNLGWPVGLPLLQATSYAVAHDGGKVVWGMADGTLRVMGCGSQLNGRGWAGGAANAGDVHPVEAHQPGTAVSCISFSTLNESKSAPLQTRTDLFASVGEDGAVNVWSLALSAGGQSAAAALGRERPRPATKLWTREVETRRAGDTLRGRVAAVEGSCIAFDAGWTGRKGRLASLAVGMTNGVVHVWTELDLDSPAPVGAYQKIEPPSSEVGSAVTTLFLDSATGASASPPGAILVHRKDATAFHRHALGPAHGSHTIFNAPPGSLGAVTAIAADFDDPPPIAIAPSNAGAVTGFEAYSTPQTPLEAPQANGAPLPTSSSLASIDSVASALGEEPPAQGETVLHGASLFGRTKYVVAGDAQGRVLVWNWEEHLNDDDSGSEATLPREVKPERVIQAGVESKVTAITITTATVVVGSLDGTVRIYDPLSSTLLRTFKERSASRIPARLLAQGALDAPEEERWLVRDIKADREGLVVNVGGKILAWRVKDEFAKGDKKKGGAKGARGGRLSARVERFRAEQELRHQVQDSLSTLSIESEERVQSYARGQRVTREFGLPQSLDGLTEEEAVSLALMLSLDEGAQSAAGGGAGERWEEEWDEGESGYTEDWDGGGDDGWEMDGIDERSSVTGRSFGNRRSSHAGSVADTDEHYSTTNPASPRVGSFSASTSLSVPQSPYLRGSSLGSSPTRSAATSPPANGTRDWIPTSPPVAPYQPYAYSPGANQKIQLSPRLGPVYETRANNVEEDVPDLDDEIGFPSIKSTSPAPSPLPAAVGAVQAQAQGKGKASETGASTPVTTPAKKGWSAVAASPSPAASADGSPAVAASPSAWSSEGGATPWSTTSPSHLSRQFSGATLTTPSRQGGSGPFLHEALRESADEERRKREEDELAFVLALSLAEEESRKEM